MNQNIQPIRREIGNELASQWLKLSSEVRQGVEQLKLHNSCTNLEPQTLKVHQDTLLLCDHFDKLHNDVQAFLTVLDQENLSTDISSLEPSKKNAESYEQSIKAQEKEHEQSDSLKDVIKALFMWRDNDTESKII